MFQYNNITKDAIIIMSREADKKRKEVPERIGAYDLLNSRQVICLLKHTYRYQETVLWRVTLHNYIVGSQF